MTDRELLEQALEALGLYATSSPDVEETKLALIKRLDQPEQESVAWRNAALRVGEDLCSVNPFGYYDMTAQQWLDWALSVVTVHNPQPEQQHEAWCASLTQLLLINPPKPAPCNCKTKLNEPQPRQWQGLTGEEVGALTVFDGLHHVEVLVLADFIRAIEAKIKEKNT